MLPAEGPEALEGSQTLSVVEELYAFTRLGRALLSAILRFPDNGQR